MKVLYILKGDHDISNIELYMSRLSKSDRTDKTACLSESILLWLVYGLMFPSNVYWPYRLLSLPNFLTDGVTCQQMKEDANFQLLLFLVFIALEQRGQNHYLLRDLCCNFHLPGFNHYEQSVSPQSTLEPDY